MRMTPEQHIEQAEILLDEVRQTLQTIPSDPRDQRGDRELRIAELAAARATAHALLAQVAPLIEIGPVHIDVPSYDEGARVVDGGAP